MKQPEIIFEEADCGCMVAYLKGYEHFFTQIRTCHIGPEHTYDFDCASQGFFNTYEKWKATTSEKAPVAVETVIELLGNTFRTSVEEHIEKRYVQAFRNQLRDFINGQ